MWDRGDWDRSGIRRGLGTGAEPGSRQRLVQTPQRTITRSQHEHFDQRSKGKKAGQLFTSHDSHSRWAIIKAPNDNRIRVLSSTNRWMWLHRFCTLCCSIRCLLFEMSTNRPLLQQQPGQPRAMSSLKVRRIGAVIFGFANFVMLYQIMSAAEFEQLQAATGRFRSNRRLAKGVAQMKARYKEARDEMTQQLIREYGQEFYSKMFLVPEVDGSQSAELVSAGRSTFISLGGGRNAVKVDLGQNETVSLSWRRLVRNMMIKLVQALDRDQSKRPTIPTSAQRVWHSEKQSRRPAVDSTVPTSWTEGHERLFRVSGHELQFERPVTFVWVRDIVVWFGKAPH
jgi:hypothetical protein